jgi:hypothetical protein
VGAVPPGKRSKLLSVSRVLNNTELYGLSELSVEPIEFPFVLFDGCLFSLFPLLLSLLFSEVVEFLVLTILLIVILIVLIPLRQFRNHIQNLFRDFLVDDFEGFGLLQGLSTHFEW